MRKALCVVLSALTVLQPLEGVAQQQRSPGFTGLGFDPKLDAAISYAADHNYSPEAKDTAQRGYILDMIYNSDPLSRRGETQALVDLFATRGAEAYDVMMKQAQGTQLLNSDYFRKIPQKEDVALFRKTLTEHPEQAHQLFEAVKNVSVGVATENPLPVAVSLPAVFGSFENWVDTNNLKEKALMLLGPSERGEFSWSANKLPLAERTIGIEVTERAKRNARAREWVN